MYKKEYEQVFEIKHENWKKKNDYKNLKNFSHQVDKVRKDEAEKGKEDGYETDQELPPWIKVPKNRFNEIKDVITRSNESRLITSIGKRKITLKNAEKLLKGIINGKIVKNEARKMDNSIVDDANRVNKLQNLQNLQNPEKIIPIFKQLQEIFMGTEADDKTDDEADDTADDEADDEADNDMDYQTDDQPDTTDMLETDIITE